MNKLIEFINMQIAFVAGEIDYIEYSKFFRRKDNLIIQSVIIFGFIFVMGFIYNVPIYATVWISIVGVYGIFMQVNATTFKKQMINAVIWGVTSFIISAIALIIAVEFGFLE